MSDESTEESKKAPQEDKKSSSQSVSEFLQAPRKKRKSYVTFALGPLFDSELAAAMEGYVRREYSHLGVASPKNIAELKRQFQRQFALLVIDDEFDELDAVMHIVRVLKQKKHQSQVPVLFLTRRPDVLVETYHQHLLPYHELDEYVAIQGLPPHHVLSRIKQALDTGNRRRSRRYKVDLNVFLWHLGDQQPTPGRLLDLSVHGGLLKSATEGRLFRVGDQLKITLPTARYLPPLDGEFLHLSAKVRRVYIAGDSAGISFEYVSEKQLLTLTRFLTALVGQQLVKRAQEVARKAR